MDTEPDKKANKQKTLHVYVCTGTNCTFRGATQLLTMLRSDDSIRTHCGVHEMSCFENRCDHAKRSPMVRIDGDIFENAQVEEILEEIHRRLNSKR